MLQIPHHAQLRHLRYRFGTGQVRKLRVETFSFQINAPISGHLLLRCLPHQIELAIIAGKDLAELFREFLALPIGHEQVVTVSLLQLRRHEKRLIIEQRRIDVRAERLAACGRQG